MHCSSALHSQFAKTLAIDYVVIKSHMVRFGSIWLYSMSSGTYMSIYSSVLYSTAVILKSFIDIRYQISP